MLETERAESSKRIEALEKDQVEKDREIESCKERLKQFGDYDELRRELEIMKVRSHYLDICTLLRRFADNFWILFTSMSNSQE